MIRLYYLLFQGVKPCTALFPCISTMVSNVVISYVLSQNRLNLDFLRYCERDIKVNISPEIIVGL